MYDAIDLVTQAMQEIEQRWERHKPRNCSEIEILVQKREKDAKVIALTELLNTLKKRDSMLILTKENTEVEWVSTDDKNNDSRYAIMRSGDFELIFDRIGISYIRVKDDYNYFNDISLEIEKDFVRHDFNSVAPGFFIEKSFLSELSDLADKFMQCDECGYVLNECECCGECGKYECECECCENCGEYDCCGDCQDEE